MENSPTNSADDKVFWTLGDQTKSASRPIDIGTTFRGADGQPTEDSPARSATSDEQYRNYPVTPDSTSSTLSPSTEKGKGLGMSLLRRDRTDGN